MRRVLISGGAGFVGSQLALRLRETHPDSTICVMDNLRRRGSEINLPRLKEASISFHHGDVRIPEDWDDLPGYFDLVIDASAEPSVLAGIDQSPRYVLQTNLTGTLNALEFVRSRGARLLFLSTSRVYSINPLRELALEENETRFELQGKQISSGISKKGIAEQFPTHLPRSLYGASKLASELLIQEYVSSYGLGAVINRCGVIAGPGQFGKTDQGVFTLWVARHHFGLPLVYTGFGGLGKQVRDLLHPRDLYRLIERQWQDDSCWNALVFNVGGGAAGSVSLAELTPLCEQATGRQTRICSQPSSPAVDIPWYVSDNSVAEARFGWKPEASVSSIVGEIAHWLRSEEARLRPIFCAE